MRARRLILGSLTGIFALAGACAGPAEQPDASAESVPSEPDSGTIRLVDATDDAGIDFVHTNGASATRYLPETMGSGVAFTDLDGDDRPDLLFVDGAPVGGSTGEQSSATGSAAQLYRNRGDGTFEEVSGDAGFGSRFLAMGVATGDVDGDGTIDVFLSGVGEQRLYRNLGGLRFEDVTATSGLAVQTTPDDVGFGASAVFFDADRDGDLDLLVGRYVPWSQATDVRCSPDGVHHTYCTPEVYPSAANVFYRNDGAGRFLQDPGAGLDEPAGKTLGLAVLDVDLDGWPDVAVANDTDRNHLFLNRGDGTFDEQGIQSGLAYSVSGATRGAMGIDSGDLDGDGWTDLVVGNFAQEMSAVYLGGTGGLFQDQAARLGVGLPSLMQVAFGTLLADLDLDGHLDLILANGHIEPEINRSQPIQTYRQPLGVFRNDGEALHRIGPGQGVPETSYVGRGLAAADADGDGDLDLVLTQNGAAARFLRNDTPRPEESWLRVRLRSRGGPTPAYGARITAVTTQRRLLRFLRAGSSYLSTGEASILFGLAPGETIERLELLWPSGTEQIVENISLATTLLVEETASD